VSALAFEERVLADAHLVPVLGAVVVVAEVIVKTWA
jgi:hypothetical protein